MEWNWEGNGRRTAECGTLHGRVSVNTTLCLCETLDVSSSYHLSSVYWQTPIRALPYWRLVAKYPYLLPFSMPYGPQSSEAEHPHQLFSVRWFLVIQRFSSSLLLVLEQQRWHGGGLPQGLSELGVQKNLRRRDFTPSESGKHPVIRYSGLSHW